MDLNIVRLCQHALVIIYVSGISMGGFSTFPDLQHIKSVGLQSMMGL